MSAVLQLDDTLRGASWTEDGALELGIDLESSQRLWAAVLSMALRDGASSIHYHPWNGDAVLSYIVDGTRYILVHPSNDLAENFLTVAREWITPHRSLLRPMAGPPTTCAGRIVIKTDRQCSEWLVVCWS